MEIREQDKTVFKIVFISGLTAIGAGLVSKLLDWIFSARVPT